MKILIQLCDYTKNIKYHVFSLSKYFRLKFWASIHVINILLNCITFSKYVKYITLNFLYILQHSWGKTKILFDTITFFIELQNYVPRSQNYSLWSTVALLGLSRTLTSHNTTVSEHTQRLHFHTRRIPYISCIPSETLFWYCWSSFAPCIYPPWDRFLSFSPPTCHTIFRVSPCCDNPCF